MGWGAVSRRLTYDRRLGITSNILAELYSSIIEFKRKRLKDNEEIATYQGDAISLNFAVALRMDGALRKDGGAYRYEIYS